MGGGPGGAGVAKGVSRPMNDFPVQRGSEKTRTHDHPPGEAELPRRSQGVFFPFGLSGSRSGAWKRRGVQAEGCFPFLRVNPSSFCGDFVGIRSRFSRDAVRIRSGRGWD